MDRGLRAVLSHNEETTLSASPLGSLAMTSCDKLTLSRLSRLSY
jgi:hypothetical protein